MNTPFRTDVIQTKYFIVEDVVELRHDLDRWFAGFALGRHA
jgi:phenylalanine-4-hydroxylase